MIPNRKIVLVWLVAILLLILTACDLPRPDLPAFTLPSFTVPSITLPSFTLPPTEPTLPQSVYEAEDFTLDGEFLTCDGADTLLGIDVSRYQKDVNWKKVKAAGIDFVIVRLGYRGYETGLLNEDAYARKNLQGAREAGLLVGAYFFSQALTPEEAREEARFSMEILGDFQLDLPLTFDWEEQLRTENVDGETVTACALAFCDEVQQAGITPMIYFNPRQAAFVLDLHQLTDYPWWLAMYDVGREFPCRFDLWQYTCTGKVDGIKGNVDINILIKK